MTTTATGPDARLARTPGRPLSPAGPCHPDPERPRPGPPPSPPSSTTSTNARQRPSDDTPARPDLLHRARPLSDLTRHLRLEWADGTVREGWLRVRDAQGFTGAVPAEAAGRLLAGAGRPGAYTPGALFGSGLTLACGGEYVTEGLATPRTGREALKPWPTAASTRDRARIAVAILARPAAIVITAGTTFVRRCW
jgi:hypothetical protein